MKKRILFAAILAASIVGSATAQTASPNKPTVGKPWTGEMGIRETVDEIMARDAGEIIVGPPRFVGPEHVGARNKKLPPRPGSENVSQWPPAPRNAFGGRGGPLNPQTIGTSFIGADVNASGFVPPDSMADVGPTQILMCLNGRIKVFSKAGALGALNTTPESFFSSVRNGAGVADPFVRFDKISQRWFVSAFNTAIPNRILLAVSSGATITGAASFTFFQFQHDFGAANSDSGGFADYVSMGIDANALYLGDNVFNGALTAFLGTSGFVVRKTSVLGAGPIVVTAFRQMAPASGAGPFAPRGVDQTDPAASVGYFIGPDNATFSRLMIRRVSTPGGTPTLSANLQVNVPTTVFPQNSPCLGSTNPLDGLDDRLYQARMFKNRLTGVTTLWTSHHIEVNSSGVGNTAGNRNGSRWYELQNLTTTPALKQSGTLFDPAASNPNNYHIPSVAMSGQGHMALACSASGAARRAEIVTAGRLASDALGTIQAPTTVQTSSTNYNIGLTNQGDLRWGDYSAINVDPMDDMTMWSIQEYCSATNVWAVRIFQLKAPPPATVSTLVPNTLAQGATTNIVVNGTVVAGSGWFDTEAGMNRLAAAFSGTGLTVNTVTFTNPTQVTLNVTATGGATVGARNLTMTNPDGQALTANGVLTVTSSNNPVPTTTSLSPNTRAAGLGGFTLTVNGTNFVGSGVSVVRWNGSDRTTTFVNATQVTAAITAADVLLSGTSSVTVFNSAPGGGLSNAQTFTVTKGSAQNVNPGSVVTTIGFEFAGGLPEILTSNNAYYQALNDDGTLVCQVEVQSNSAPDMGTLGQTDFNFETVAARAGLTLTVSLFNHTSGLYEDLSSGVAPIVDTSGLISVTSNAARFVNNTTQNCRARFTWGPINDEDPAADGWVLSIDRATWAISP